MAKILLVEDNEMNRDMLSRRLERKGHEVVTAADGECAVAMARSESPDVILMDLNLPVLDGWAATRRIKDAAETRSIPVIALTAHAMSGDRQKALGAGCDDYDTKPVELPRLLGKIEALLEQKAATLQTAALQPAGTASQPVSNAGTAAAAATEPPLAPLPKEADTTPPAPAQPQGRDVPGRVLVVDDTPANRDMLSRRLEKQGFDVGVASDGETALEMLGRRAFDVVLLDVMMPGLNGLDVLKAVRQKWARTEMPVIMATAKDASHDIVEALDLGANDYVTKPLDFPVVLARVRTQLSLKRAVEQIRDLEKGLEQRNAELQAANARMRGDLAAAAKVQEALLPVASPEVPGYSFGWRFKPSAWLAGDILNVFRLGERHVGLYLLDVSGHGVAAALLSVTVSRFLSPACDPASLLWWREGSGGGYRLQPPARVAARLGERFPLDEATGQFFTLVYGLLDLATHRLRFVSAGHPPVIHVAREAAPRMLTAVGYPIGVSEDEYEEHEIELSPRDRVYVYSDGVPEAMDASDRPFGPARLLEQIERTRGEGLDGTLTALVERIDRWRGDGRVHDDLSVLALERTT